MQDIPDLKYKLVLLVESEAIELQMKDNQTWAPLGPDHDLLTVRLGNVTGQWLTVVKVAHVRSRSKLSVGSPL